VEPQTNPQAFDPASFEHIPVLLNECLDGLAIDPAGTYLDGTAGGVDRWGGAVWLFPHKRDRCMVAPFAVWQPPYWFGMFGTKRCG